MTTAKQKPAQKPQTYENANGEIWDEEIECWIDPGSNVETREAPPPTPPTPRPTSEASTSALANDFNNVPLGLLAVQIAEVVNEQERVHDYDISKLFATNYMVRVPSDLHRMFNRFVWSAKGRGFIQRDDDTGAWLEGDQTPEPDPRFGDWTLGELVKTAGQLMTTHSHDEAFAILVRKLNDGDGRVPKLVMSVVGTALNRAQNPTLELG